MKKFAVIPNLYKDPKLQLATRIANMLAEDGKTADVITEKCGPDTLQGYDCAIVLGGDGTILDIAKKAAFRGIPVAGVNLGKIGYLSSVEPDDIEKLLKIDKDTPILKRMMLSLSYRGTEYPALNDIVISEEKATKMISVAVSVNKETISEYNSTSLIFSTPTGSSGYNVSAGGPVIDPSIECIAVTPVCPHTGTPHCFIFDRDTEFIAENVSSADKKVIVTVDGGEDLRIDPGERVTVRRADAYVRLLAFDGEYFTRKMLRKLKI